MARSALIVDDSRSMRKIIKSILSQNGFETVLQGENGQHALDHFSQAEVDIVITDINMPEMDGITLVKRLRAQPDFTNVPILVLSTESQSTLLQKGKEAGANGWVLKPFKPEQLMYAIDQVTSLV